MGVAEVVFQLNSPFEVFYSSVDALGLFAGSGRKKRGEAVFTQS